MTGKEPGNREETKGVNEFSLPGELLSNSLLLFEEETPAREIHPEHLLQDRDTPGSETVESSDKIQVEPALEEKEKTEASENEMGMVLDVEKQENYLQEVKRQIREYLIKRQEYTDHLRHRAPKKSGGPKITGIDKPKPPTQIKKKDSLDISPENIKIPPHGYEHWKPIGNTLPVRPKQAEKTKKESQILLIASPGREEKNTPALNLKKDANLFSMKNEIDEVRAKSKIDKTEAQKTGGFITETPKKRAPGGEAKTPDITHFIVIKTRKKPSPPPMDMNMDRWGIDSLDNGDRSTHESLSFTGGSKTKKNPKRFGLFSMKI